MIDHAQNSLINALCPIVDSSILLLMDEHCVEDKHWHQLQQLTNLTICTNRYHHYRNAQNRNINAVFNDFEVPNHHWDYIAFRISKEKAINHHWLYLANQLLDVGKVLIFCGFKNEGIKTLNKEAELYLGNIATLSKGEKQHSLIRLKKGAQTGKKPKLANSYNLFSTVDVSLHTKPGQYGWKQVDTGSKLLADTLINSNISIDTLLDLGCGYGYLSVRMLALKPSHITATDNCATALECTKRNLQSRLNANQYSVVADDVAMSINNQFDTIICNPPYHHGFQLSTHLTQRFVITAKRLLKPEGHAYFVTKTFVNIEEMAKNSGLNHKLFIEEKGFKVSYLYG